VQETSSRFGGAEESKKVHVVGGAIKISQPSQSQEWL